MIVGPTDRELTGQPSSRQTDFIVLFHENSYTVVAVVEEEEQENRKYVFFQPHHSFQLVSMAHNTTTTPIERLPWLLLL